MNKYILQNKLGIKDKFTLNKAERIYIAIRIIELRKQHFRTFSFNTLKNMHKYIFQDIYSWAGTTRNVNISKGNTIFCLIENINPYSNSIFQELKANNYFKNLSINDFCKKSADLFGDINALHPFREGNGRTQREFFYHLALNAGYNLDLNFLNKDEYILASINSISGNNKNMEKLMQSIIKPAKK